MAIGAPGGEVSVVLARERVVVAVEDRSHAVNVASLGSNGRADLVTIRNGTARALASRTLTFRPAT